LALVGRNGLREIAAKNVENMHSLSARINQLEGLRSPQFKSAHFNEFVVGSDIDSEKIHKGLLSKGVQGGLVLDKMFPELKHATLYATTEMHTRQDHDKLIKALGAVL
jgi:glycine cleavage system pyridoxal-binding protein P